VEKTTLYTAVPINRIFSIERYGLLTNDKVSELEGAEIFDEFNEELKGRVFDEPSWGYIYASTDFNNALDWGRTIQLQTELKPLILEYKIDDSLIERDKCSPNKSILDVRFKANVNADDIIVISGTIDSKGNIEDVSRIPLRTLCDQAQIKCENCKELTRYREMVRFMGDTLICKECADDAKKFAEKIGTEGAKFENVE
jgi:hypothetical protein